MQVKLPSLRNRRYAIEARDKRKLKSLVQYYKAMYMFAKCERGQAVLLGDRREVERLGSMLRNTKLDYRLARAVLDSIEDEEDSDGEHTRLNRLT